MEEASLEIGQQSPIAREYQYVGIYICGHIWDNIYGIYGNMGICGDIYEGTLWDNTYVNLKSHNQAGAAWPL